MRIYPQDRRLSLVTALRREGHVLNAKGKIDGSEETIDLLNRIFGTRSTCSKALCPFEMSGRLFQEGS